MPITAPGCMVKPQNSSASAPVPTDWQTMPEVVRAALLLVELLMTAAAISALVQSAAAQCAQH